MAHWKDEYLGALEARDKVEKANLPIYEAYTRIADRNAELSQAQLSVPSPDNALSSPPPLPIVGKKGAKPPPKPPPSESLIRLRQDLAKAQQDREEMQRRLDAATKELEALRAKSKTDNRRITQLSAGVTQMTVRLRDRDEELKGKTKMLEHVQDELVTLNLQLNMADDQTNELKRENQELVDRWMARMGKEADAMNNESKFA